MPIYEYICQKCGKKSEELQKIGATGEGLTCKACGSNELQKAISVHCVGKSKPEPAAHSCGSGGCCGGGACGF